MIHPDSLTIAWMQRIASRLGKVDSALLEKAIRALFLAEQLQVKGLDFQFKGGTSLLIQLPKPRRFSIDVDIITTNDRAQLTIVLNKLITEGFFNRWEQDQRKQQHLDLPVEHFKLFYTSHYPGFIPEHYILLDVIYQENLPAWTEKKPVLHEWLQPLGAPVMLNFSTQAGLLGDKLTAFAPTTTGILYSKNRPLEIIKQLYDIGALFNEVSDLTMVKGVFEQVATQEINFRGLSIQPHQVLEDAFQAALTICDRNEKDANFQHLKTGIRNIKPHIFHRFILEDATIAACKVMYLSTLISQSNPGPPRRFNQAQEVLAWEISTTEHNRFNRFKKTNPEAFYYAYQTWQLLKNG